MNYYYNVTLNFNALKFYEWTLEDELIELKKVPVFRLNEKDLVCLYKYNGNVESSFLMKIKNKSIYKKEGILKTNLYIALFTDTKFCLAIMFDKEGSIIKRSHLLLEDELNVIEIGYGLKKEKLVFYKKEKILYSNNYKQEDIMKNIILNEIDKSYKNKEVNKLRYYYLECFKTNCLDIKKIYKELKEKINGENNFDLESMYKVINMVTK